MIENYMIREEEQWEKDLRRRGAEEELNRLRGVLEEITDRMEEMKEDGMTDTDEYDEMLVRAKIVKKDMIECMDIIREWC